MLASPLTSLASAPSPNGVLQHGSAAAGLESPIIRSMAQTNLLIALRLIVTRTGFIICMIVDSSLCRGYLVQDLLASPIMLVQRKDRRDRIRVSSRLSAQKCARPSSCVE